MLFYFPFVNDCDNVPAHTRYALVTYSHVIFLNTSPSKWLLYLYEYCTVGVHYSPSTI